MNDFPRWLVDDTAELGDARIFVAHLHRPRFVGELMPDDEAEIAGVTIAAPLGQTLCRIDWIDDPVFDAEELCRSLAAAIEHHDSIRST